MKPFVLALFALPDKRPNLSRLQGAQNTIRIIATGDLAIPERPLVSIEEGWFLRIPKLFVGLDPSKEDTQLICVGENRHGTSISKPQPAVQI